MGSWMLSASPLFAGDFSGMILDPKGNDGDRDQPRVCGSSSPNWARAASWSASRLSHLFRSCAGLISDKAEVPPEDLEMATVVPVV